MLGYRWPAAEMRSKEGFVLFTGRMKKEPQTYLPPNETAGRFKSGFLASLRYILSGSIRAAFLSTGWN